MAINYFHKTLSVDVSQGSEYGLDFEYASILNILGFWIYQGCRYARGSKYASGSGYVRVLDILSF